MSVLRRIVPRVGHRHCSMSRRYPRWGHNRRHRWLPPHPNGTVRQRSLPSSLFSEILNSGWRQDNVTCAAHIFSGLSPSHFGTAGRNLANDGARVEGSVGNVPSQKEKHNKPIAKRKHGNKFIDGASESTAFVSPLQKRRDIACAFSVR